MRPEYPTEFDVDKNTKELLDEGLESSAREPTQGEIDDLLEKIEDDD